MAKLWPSYSGWPSYDSLVMAKLQQPSDGQATAAICPMHPSGMPESKDVVIWRRVHLRINPLKVHWPPQWSQPTVLKVHWPPQWSQPTVLKVHWPPQWSQPTVLKVHWPPQWSQPTVLKVHWPPQWSQPTVLKVQTPHDGVNPLYLQSTSTLVLFRQKAQQCPKCCTEETSIS